jgi:hypothetical protein
LSSDPTDKLPVVTATTEFASANSNPSDLTSIPVSFEITNTNGSLQTFFRQVIIDQAMLHSFISPDMLCNSVLIELESDINCHRYISFFDVNGTRSGFQCFALKIPLRINTWSLDLDFLVSTRFRQHDMVLGVDFLNAFNAISSSIHSIDGSDVLYLDTNTTVSVSNEEVDRITSTSTSLLKTQGAIKIFGEFETDVVILFDGGSTHSFISPKILNHAHLTHMVTEDTLTKQRRNFCITSATQNVTSHCTVTIAAIQIQGWSGKYQFTISDRITKNDVVIGRDFLKHFGVIINHGSDTLQLQDNLIRFIDASIIQAIPSNVNKIVTFDDKTELIPNDNSSGSDENIASLTNKQSTGPTVKIASAIPLINYSTDDLDCHAACSTTIPPLSQRLVELLHGKIHNDKDFLFFEPFYPMPIGCLIARSINSSTDKIFCNVINTLVVPVTINKGSLLGRFVDGVLAENNDYNEQSNTITRQSQIKQSIAVFEAILNETSCPPHADAVQWKNVCSIPTGVRLSAQQLFKLRIVLLKNYSAFQWDPNGISRTNLVEHSINTGDHPPIRTKQYPIPTVAMEHIRAQAAQMLKDGTIRHSHSSWQSPILLIKQSQPDGSTKYRFCVDLRKVNAVTARDSYNLPRISETVDKLNGMMFFSNGDIDRAFWQVGVVEKDKCKHAFNVDGTLYEGNVMSFGSMNAPATFQRLMDTILKGLTWKQCLAYIDDILIFSRTFDAHLQHIDEVLSRIMNASLKLKPSKCSFGNHEVEYLGFRISDEGIQPSRKKVERLLQVKPPKTPDLLHSYLCSINFYRQDIPHFGHITAELHEMAASKVKFLTWTNEALRHFARLQQAFASAPILAFPDFDKPFYIQGDASAKAIGGACLQKHTSKPKSEFVFRPNCFFGRKLTKTERRWSATERELLALVYGYHICYHLVFGRRIVFLSDHKPLATLDKLKLPFGRLGQLLFKLEGVDYTIQYIEGAKNFLPDFLSRANFEELTKAVANSILVTSSINWAQEQARDEEILRIMACIRKSATEANWKECTNGSRWFRERTELFILNNVLYHGKTRLVVPSHLKSNIMSLHHDSPFAGHRGSESMFKALEFRYYWNYMMTEIKNFCRSCTKCQKYNYSVIHNRAPMKSIEVTRRNQIWILDYMGPFKVSRHGNKYIILGCDAQDKWLEGCATPTFDAPTTASFTFNNIICRYGMVERLLTDQGVSFENHLFKELCRLVGTDKLHSSTYHAMGHGQVERVNKVIKPNLAKYVNDDEDDWDLYLQMAISSYNHSFHESIGMSPFEARFGYKPTLLADVIMNNKSQETDKHLSNFASGMIKFADHINNVLNENKAAAQHRQKYYYDRILHANAYFRIGDRVKITNYRVRPGHSKAFEPKFLGPYTIVQRSNEFNYLLSSPNARNELVHYNRMSHFRDRELEQCGSPLETFVKPSVKQPKRIQAPLAPKPSLNLFMASSSVASATKVRRANEFARAAATGRDAENRRRIESQNKDRDARALTRNNDEALSTAILEIPPEVEDDNLSVTSSGIRTPLNETELENFINFQNRSNAENTTEPTHQGDEFLSFENNDTTIVNNVQTSSVILPPLNDKGKEQVFCPHCLPIQKLCEKTVGLRSHIRHAHPQLLSTENLISTPMLSRTQPVSQVVVTPTDAAGGGGVVTD